VTQRRPKEEEVITRVMRLLFAIHFFIPKIFTQPSLALTNRKILAASSSANKQSRNSIGNELILTPSTCPLTSEQQNNMVARINLFISGFLMKIQNSVFFSIAALRS
jgi:hypothetical protein